MARTAAGLIDVEGKAYLIVRLFFLLVIITILAEVIIFLIIITFLILEIIELLESESLASEPVDGTRNKLLLDIFTKLVVKLQALLDVRSTIVVLLLFLGLRGLGWREEVEERFCGDSLLDNASLFRV